MDAVRAGWCGPCDGLTPQSDLRTPLRLTDRPHRATSADESILTAQVFDHIARLRTFEIVAEVRDRMTAA